MNLNKYYPLVIPLIIMALFELVFFSSQTIYACFVFSNIAIVFAIFSFSKASTIEKDWWNYAIFPVVFSSSLMVYSVLLSSKFFIQFLIVVDVILLYHYLRSVYYYILQPEKYLPSSIENFSSYGNFFAFFFTAASIFGLRAFLNISDWVLALILLFSAVLIIYEVFWANKIQTEKSAILILICGIILTEISWASFFLPFNFNITGLIIAVCYYMLIGISRFYLLDRLNKKTIHLYLGYGFISVLLILLTAKWI